MMPSPRDWLIAAGYAALLLAIHLAITRGTGTIGLETKTAFGSDAGSTLSRPWAYLTSQFLHNTWGHIGYNLTVLMATLPFALHAYGARTLLLVVASSVLAALIVNVLLVLPLQSAWAPAAGVLHGRLVGASIAIFAGAGMAWSAWDAPAAAKGALLGGYILYELALTLLGFTGPFVALYHVTGAAVGIGFGVALSLPK